MEPTLSTAETNAASKQSKRTSASTSAQSKTTKVPVSLQASRANTVAIAGSFNAWDPKKNPLRQENPGNWKTQLDLAPGRYEYRFVVDGQWLDDPKATQLVGNPYGGTNCVLVVQ
jgi:1,4-alpha-glucan branching enzyme